MFDQATLNSLFIVYSVYVIAAGSPGPSSIAIMSIAMHTGRTAALAFAAGVMTGSIFWGSLAATGISAVLATYAHAITLIKIAGGAYLLWLAWKSARSAMRPNAALSVDAIALRSLRRQYVLGLMMHLTNPKSILAWLAIMALGLGGAAQATTTALAIIGGCALLGIIIFGGYALLFSTAPMVRFYARARRWIEGTLAAVFAYAGIRLLLLRT